MWKTFWPQGFGDHPKLQHLLGGWRIWLPNNFTTPHEPNSTHRLRYGRFDDGYHQHTTPTHSYNLMAMFFILTKVLQAFVLSLTAIAFTACTFLSLFVSLPLAVYLHHHQPRILQPMSSFWNHKGRGQWKKNVFFRVLPESPKPPPPPDPNSGNLVLFFRTTKMWGGEGDILTT